MTGAKVSGRDETGLRRGLASRGLIEARGLPEAFTLVVKHNAAFAAGISVLAERFPTVAIVRHPLAVLASWQTVPHPVSQGRVPAGEHNDPVLRDALTSSRTRSTVRSTSCGGSSTGSWATSRASP